MKHLLFITIFIFNTANASSQNLRHYFKQAQGEFLAGKKSAAEHSFNKVVSLRLTHFWQPTDRELITAAYLRLAQINKNRASIYIKEALEFDPKLKANENYFPPPMVREVERAKKSLEWKLIDAPENLTAEDQVFINSQKLLLTPDRKISWVDSLVRVDAVRNGEIINSKIAPLQQVSQLKIPAVPQPQSLQTNAPEPILPPDLPKISEPINLQSNTPKWVWWGLGAAIVTFIWMQDRETKVHPTHRRSFNFSF